MREQIIDSIKAVLRPVVKHRFLLEKMKYSGEKILSAQEGNDLISRLVEQRAAVAKIGGTEMKLSRVYLRRRDAAGNCRSFGRYARMIYVSSGVYPNDPVTLTRFCQMYLPLLNDLDLLAVWFNFGEAAARKRYAPHTALTELLALEPYFHECPWSSKLAGKRVVVVSPFAKTIESQYRRRKEIWPTKPDVLPEFELRVIRCPQIAGLIDQPEYPDWFAGLEGLKQQMAAQPFDAAIIGAGAWSLPLTVHAKALGAFGIHMGGSTQILFGITGHRWDGNAEINAYRNDAWTRPSKEERPNKFRLQENGSYW
jgi:hypothetical protein